MFFLFGLIYFFSVFLKILFFGFPIALCWLFIVGLFLYLFCQEFSLGDGEVDDDGSALVVTLVEFLDGFLARSVVGQFHECESLIAFLIVRVQWHLDIYYFSVGGKQFSQVLFSYIEYKVSNDKSILLPELFLLFLFFLLVPLFVGPSYLELDSLLLLRRVLILRNLLVLGGLGVLDLDAGLFWLRFGLSQLFAHQQQIKFILQFSNMEAIKGVINIDQAFSCQKCKTIAYEPFVSDCCEAIICNNCLNQGIKCPFCDRVCKLKSSVLLNSIYKLVTCDCPYNCESKLNLYEIKVHITNCPEATTKCPYCKTMTKIKSIPQHLGEAHIQQCNRMLIEFHRAQEDQKPDKISQPPQQARISPFKIGITGNYNIEPRISCAGRMVCGRPLADNRNVAGHSMSSSSFFHKATTDMCSIQYGSCDRCMQLDVDRLGLPKSYLLNLEGRICIFIKEKKKVACGCSNGSRTCNDEVQCTPCKRLLAMIERGFYKKLTEVN